MSMQHTNKARAERKRTVLSEPSKPKTKKAGPRSDLATARKTEDTYIAKINPPALGSRPEWVKSAYARGVSLKEIIRGSGFRTRQVFDLVGLSPDAHPELVAELESYRINLLNHKD